MPPPVIQAPVKIVFPKPSRRAKHVVIDQQSNRTEDVSLPRSVLSDNRVRPLLEKKLRVRKIPVINETQFRDIHGARV